MKDFPTRMLRRFYRDAQRLSRNRYFHAYLEPRVRNAARAGRLLRSLRNDLINRKLITVRMRSANGLPGNWVLLEIMWDGARRTSYLTESELSILREDEQIDRLLNQAEWPNSADL